MNNIEEKFNVNKWYKYCKLKIIFFNIILLCFVFLYFNKELKANSFKFDNQGIELFVNSESDEDDINLKITITNKNPYAKSRIKFSLNNNSDFTVSGKKEYEFLLDANEEKEIIKKYYNNNSLYNNIDDIVKKKKHLIPFNVFDDENLNVNRIYDEIIKVSNIDIATNSFIDTFNNYKKSKNFIDIDRDTKISKMLILLIILIVFIIILLVMIFIYKIYHKDFFIIFLICILGLNQYKNIANEFNIDSFLFNKEYLKNYKVEILHNNMPYTFSFDLKWVYEGDNAYEESDMDSDGDKVLDKNEVIFMTDVHNADTDGDSLSDYVEIYLINTSPIRIDSDNNGISDYDEDFDGDYLSNGEEVRYNTSLTEIDTDFDGLTDYEEVKIYNTNPLMKDSDSDGLTDFEEIKLSLNPLNKFSDGINKDNEVKKYQELSNNMFDDNIYTENVIDVKIKGNVVGLIDEHIKVKECNNSIVENNIFILGKPIKIETDYEDKFTLQFDCKDYENLSDGLRVCTIENGKIKMLNTDIDGYIISSDVGNGEYFLMDCVSFTDSIISYMKEEHK